MDDDVNICNLFLLPSCVLGQFSENNETVLEEKNCSDEFSIEEFIKKISYATKKIQNPAIRAFFSPHQFIFF